MIFVCLNFLCFCKFNSIWFEDCFLQDIYKFHFRNESFWNEASDNMFFSSPEQRPSNEISSEAMKPVLPNFIYSIPKLGEQIILFLS